MAKDVIVEQRLFTKKPITSNISYDPIEMNDLMEYILLKFNRLRYIGIGYIGKKYFRKTGKLAHPRTIKSILIQCGYRKSTFGFDLWTAEKEICYG